MNDELKPEGAIENLREYQQQLDHDGVMVGVSRQALDEVLDYLNTRTPSEPVACNHVWGDRDISGAQMCVRCGVDLDDLDLEESTAHPAPSDEARGAGLFEKTLGERSEPGTTPPDTEAVRAGLSLAGTVADRCIEHRESKKEARRLLDNAERELEELPDQVNVNEALAFIALAKKRLAQTDAEGE